MPVPQMAKSQHVGPSRSVTSQAQGALTRAAKLPGPVRAFVANYSLWEQPARTATAKLRDLTYRPRECRRAIACSADGPIAALTPSHEPETPCISYEKSALPASVARAVGLEQAVE